MNKKRGLLLLFLSIFMLQFVNAGLIINNSISINKTLGSNPSTSIIVANGEPYSFYNVSFESNPYIYTNKFTITSGQQLSVPVTIVSNVSGTFSVKLQGFYQANIGSSNQSYSIPINSYNAPSQCDFTIIEGDRVTWKNNLQNTVTLRNNANNIAFATLLPNQTYTQIFSPGALSYNLDVSGFVFASCTISALNGSGLVHNPSMDATLNLTTLINYVATTLNATAMTTNFTLNFFDNSDGILLLNNLGTSTAYNITLEGSWLSFNNNNFNMNPGESKAVVYTVIPSVTQTSDTNKTYIKTIKITGNFPEVDRDIQIFINPANIDFSGNASRADIDYLINVFCPKYPTSILCGQNQSIVYKYINNGSDQFFNVSMSTEQVKELWLYQISQGEDIKTTNNFVKATMDDINNQNNQTNLNINNITQTLQQQNDEQNSRMDNIIGFGALIFGVMAIGIIIFLTYFFKKRNLSKELENW